MEKQTTKTTDNSTSVKIEQYVLERIKKNDVEIHLPKEAIFIHEDHHRIVTGIFPELFAQENNRVCRIWVVRADGNSIERTSFATNPIELSEIVSGFDKKGKSYSQRLVDEAVMYLRDYYQHGTDRISREQFMAAYNYTLSQFQDIFG